MATQAQIAAVQQLYIGYLGRAAEKAGLDFWTNAISNGTATLATVAQQFTQSTEYTTNFGGLTSDALVEKVYTSVLGRASDAAGKAYWVDLLAKGTITNGQLVSTFINSLSTADQTIINNKTFVAQTYTDTVGTTNYNGEAGKAVIAGVTGDSATVTAALNAINTGTLAGQVPGQGLIKAYVAAQDAVTAYGKAAATANPTFDTSSPKDGVVTSTEAGAALTAANTARFTDISASTTRQLQADAADKAEILAKTKVSVEAQTGGAAAITAYEAAVTANKTAVDANTAAAAAIAASEAGLDKAVTTTGSAVTYATLSAAAGVTTAFASGADVTAFLADKANVGTAATAKLVAELNKVPTFGAGVIDAGTKGLAVVTTGDTLNDATTKLNAIDTNGATAGTNTYIADKTASTAAAELVTKAQAADVKLATAQGVVDQYAALNKAAADADAAITKFASDNATKVSIQDLAGTPAADAAKTISDVFYFKSAVATGDDVTIGNFAAGDSIVLSAGYTQGTSFAAGNNNALEYFFVSTDTGTQIVFETKNFGSSEVTASATTGVAASNTDNLAVITLTGVTADHLAVNNGVISYV